MTLAVSPLLIAQQAKQVTISGPPATPSNLFHSPSPGDTPGVDSPVLYRSFFNYHDQPGNWIDSRKAANPISGKSATQDAAKLLRIQDAEYAKVAAISHSVAANLKQVESQAGSYLHGGQSQGSTVAPTAPQQTALRQYERQRRQILSDGVRQLQSSLSRESWNGLRAYLNEQHRAQIHAVPTKKR